MRICIYVRVLLVYSSCGGQKEADSLELELETNVNCHLGAENQIQVLCENSKYC